MMAKFHILKRPGADCPDCDKAAIYEVRDWRNTSYGYFCQKHAIAKVRLLNVAAAQKEQT